jgi:hypothetical protein
MSRNTVEWLSEPRTVPLRQLSAPVRRDFGFPLAMFKGHVFAMLTMCFDGSGKEDDPGTRFVTLAGFAAEQDAWDFFNAEWDRVLKGYGQRRSAQYMHMIEAIFKTGEFEGWTDDEVAILITQLATIPSMVSSIHRIQGIRFSIDASAYKRFAPQGVQPIPENLAIGSFQRLFLWYKDSPRAILEPMVILFDRGEPYLNVMMQRWNRRKSLRGKKPLWDLIKSIGAVEMQNVPGVQAADMLAWSYNRIRTRGNSDWAGQIAQRVLNLMPHLYNEVEEIHMREVRLFGEIAG